MKGGRTGTGNNNYNSHKLITSQDSSENLARFFNEIREFPSLSKSEEIELIRNYQRDHSAKSLDRLIKCNLKFVVTVAKTYQNQGVPLMDLIQEGSSGMIEAAQRFDCSKNLKFFSYAVWWIKVKIITSFELHKRLIQLPANRTLLITKMKRKVQELEDKLQRFPTVEEIRKHFPSQSIDDIQEAFSYSLLPISLQAEFFESSGDDTQLIDVLKTPNHLEIDSEDKENSLVTDLNKVLYQLEQKNYDVIILLIGLNGEEPMKADKIAYLFDLDIKAIPRMKAKAIKFLRKYKDKTNLNSYL